MGLDGTIFLFTQITYFCLQFYVSSIQNLNSIYSFDLRQSFKTFLGQKNDTFPEHFKFLYEENGFIYVGGRNRLYNLSVSVIDGTILEHKHIIWDVPDDKIKACGKYYSVKDCQNYVMLMARLSTDKFLICGTYAFEPKCRRYLSTNKPDGEGNYNVLESEISGLGYVPFNPYQNFSYSVAGGQIYSATFVDVWSEQPILYRDPVRTVHEFAPALNGPQFIHSFTHNGYAYFLFNEWTVLPSSSPIDGNPINLSAKIGRTYEKSRLSADEYQNHAENKPIRMIEARIGRVCIGDTGYLDLLYDNPLVWKTFLKVRMVCKVPNIDNNDKRKDGINNKNNDKISKGTNRPNNNYADSFKARFNSNPPPVSSFLDDPRDRRDITITAFDSLIASTSPQNILGLETDYNQERFYSVFTTPSLPGIVPISVLCQFDTHEMAKVFETGIYTMETRMIRSGVKRVRSSTIKPGQCGYDLVDPGEAEYLQKFALLLGNSNNEKNGFGSILEVEGKPLNIWSGRPPSTIAAIYNYEKREGVETDHVYLGTKEGEVYCINIDSRFYSNIYHENKPGNTHQNLAKGPEKITSIMVYERLVLSNKDGKITGLYPLAKANGLLVAIAIENDRSTSVLGSLVSNQCEGPYENFSCHGLDDYTNNMWSFVEKKKEEMVRINFETNREPNRDTPSPSSHHIYNNRDVQFKPQGSKDLTYNDFSDPRMNSEFFQISRNSINNNRIDDSPRLYQSRSNPSHCSPPPASNSYGNIAERLSLAITLSVCISSLLGFWVGFKLKTRLYRIRKNKHLVKGGGCRDLMTINMSSIRNRNKDSAKDCGDDKLERAGDKGQRFLSSFLPFVDYRFGANKSSQDDPNPNHSNNNGNNFFPFFLPPTPLNDASIFNPFEQPAPDQLSPLNVVPPCFANLPNLPNNTNNVNPFSSLTMLKHSNGQQFLYNAYGLPFNLQHQQSLPQQSPSIYEAPPQPSLPRLPLPLYCGNNFSIPGTENTLRKVYYFHQPNHYDINDNPNNRLPRINQNIPLFSEFNEFHASKVNVGATIDGVENHDENCLKNNKEDNYNYLKPLPLPKPSLNIN
ncbi:unnamed protein product [Gordionus sp. m RMFG-2023]|uniref:uncharacterized protein LOC135926996 n=1 Tax=Gordionus sp. m RMFG-2023 TaxID=3053472 RepID=UPI0030E4F660